jgi:hypothetical protein
MNKTLILLVSVALGGGAACAHTGTSASQAGQPATSRLLIRFDGGNAFVFSDQNKRVDVGTIARPPDRPAAHFNVHPMYLHLNVGEAKPVPGLPYHEPTKFERGTPAWKLDGYEVLPCPDGVCANSSELSRSPVRPPRQACDPQQDGTPVDNFFYVPDLLALHPGAMLVDDWQSRLASRIVLRTGRLIVDNASECYGIRRPGETTEMRQSIASAHSQLHYLADVKEFTDLMFRDRTTGAVVGAVRLYPAGGSTTMDVTTHFRGYPELHARQELPHFHQFYELLKGVEENQRIAIVFRPDSALRKVSPGTECPPARFGGGN